jgi:hypothetical protein
MAAGDRGLHRMRIGPDNARGTSRSRGGLAMSHGLQPRISAGMRSAGMEYWRRHTTSGRKPAQRGKQRRR